MIVLKNSFMRMVAMRVWYRRRFLFLAHQFVEKSLMSHKIKTLIQLFLKLVKSSFFWVNFFLCLIVAKYITTFGLHRADFMFFCVVAIQGILLRTKKETVAELKVIMVFHLLWFAMEVFKSHPGIGSRAYPDIGRLHLRWVPLYSGFMYSAVWSFIFKGREELNIRFTNFPWMKRNVPIATLIYINFISHHFIPDFRWLLLFVSWCVSRRTKVRLTLEKKEYQLPVGLGLFLVGICIRVAENVATFLGARAYPNQMEWRAMVDLHKIISWRLLFIVSFVIVACYKQRKKSDYGLR